MKRDSGKVCIGWAKVVRDELDRRHEEENERKRQQALNDDWGNEGQQEYEEEVDEAESKKTTDRTGQIPVML